MSQIEDEWKKKNRETRRKEAEDYGGLRRLRAATACGEGSLSG